MMTISDGDRLKDIKLEKHDPSKPVKLTGLTPHSFWVDELKDWPIVSFDPAKPDDTFIIMSGRRAGKMKLLKEITTARYDMTISDELCNYDKEQEIMNRLEMEKACQLNSSKVIITTSPTDLQSHGTLLESISLKCSTSERKKARK